MYKANKIMYKIYMKKTKMLTNEIKELNNGEMCHVNG